MTSETGARLRDALLHALADSSDHLDDLMVAGERPQALTEARRRA